jgi:hypothetical protein
MIPDLTPQEIERFYSKVYLGGCGLVWRGSDVNNHGYGRFPIYRNGKRVRILAHRLSCYLATGDDPGESKIRHGCDTPRCCTPDCLEPGTQADNIHDALERGRLNLTGLLVPHKTRRAAAVQRVDVGAKRCNKCRLVRPLHSFSRHARSLDGRQRWCKDCMTASQRERRRLKRQPLERSAA